MFSTPLSFPPPLLLSERGLANGVSPFFTLIRVLCFVTRPLSTGVPSPSRPKIAKKPSRKSEPGFIQTMPLSRFRKRGLANNVSPLFSEDETEETKKKTEKIGKKEKKSEPDKNSQKGKKWKRMKTDENGRKRKQGMITATFHAATITVNKGYPYPLGAGSARPNPKMGAPDPENPLFLGFSGLGGGLRPWSQTMVSEGGRPWGRGRSGKCDLLKKFFILERAGPILL